MHFFFFFCFPLIWKKQHTTKFSQNFLLELSKVPSLGYNWDYYSTKTYDWDFVSCLISLLLFLLYTLHCDPEEFVYSCFVFTYLNISIPFCWFAVHFLWYRNLKSNGIHATWSMISAAFGFSPLHSTLFVIIMTSLIWIKRLKRMK